MRKFYVRVAGVVLAAGCVGVLPHSTAIAAVGNCAGGLIYDHVDYASGAPIAELAVYYDASSGNNCARVNHLGASYGRSSTTEVQIARCGSTKPSQACYTHAPYPSDSGNYAYYAGPVSVNAPSNCVVASGVLNWNNVPYYFDSGPIGC